MAAVLAVNSISLLILLTTATIATAATTASPEQVEAANLDPETAAALAKARKQWADEAATEAQELEVAMQDPAKAELYRKLKEAYPDLPIHMK
jgi:hypothetical protein